MANMLSDTMKPMKNERRFRISPKVLSQEVDGEAVLLDLEGEAYFGLNEVGARIWQLLRQDHGFTELLDVLESEFDVSREQLEQDVDQLLKSLADAGLIKSA
jgi:hypothetical protein